MVMSAPCCRVHWKQCSTMV